LVVSLLSDCATCRATHAATMRAKAPDASPGRVFIVFA